MTEYKKKLIEVALPLAAINAEASREKSIRHGHPSTLHLWWARRPLAAARAVLFASLVDDPSAHPDQFPTEDDQDLERKRLFDILERLVPWEASSDKGVIAEARIEIERSCDGGLPTVLDPFGGGGAIPLEAMRLGLPTTTGDLNPVAVLIERAMLEIPGHFAGQAPVHPEARADQGLWEGARGLAADVVAYGKWMSDEAETRIGHLYPSMSVPGTGVATPTAWIWARTVKSPDPSWPAHVPLVRSWLLAKRARKPTIWIEPIVDRKSMTISYEIRTGGSPAPGTVENGRALCLATGTAISLAYVDEEAAAGRLGKVLLAIVLNGPAGRSFVLPDASQRASIDAVPSRAELEKVTELPMGKTRGTFAGNAQGRYYGFFEFPDYFTDRQLVALTTFSDVLTAVRPVIEAHAAAAGLPRDGRPLRDGGTGGRAYADAIVTYLAFAIDKCTDYWSSISGWVAGGEFTNNTFGRQAIPMSWDFAETNPFSGVGGSWHAMVQWIERVLRGPALVTNAVASVAQRDARARIEESGRCVVATDPPYYDNISYADLSDWFYVWLRRNLRDVWPDECATLLTPKAEELIANQYRAGSKQAAHAHFEGGMELVFSEAVRAADPDYPATFFYAYRATESSADGVTSTGWETFLSALLEAGYTVTATWPLRTERGGGLKTGRSMLASSVVLACRARHVSAPLATRGEFLAALRDELRPGVRVLQQQNIAPVDLAQSAIGPGIAIYSRYTKVVEADGKSMTVRAALGLINEVLSEVLSGEESEFDADTRFALTWFEQYGHTAGPFGDADLLARAKDTTVAGVAQSSVAVNRDGKVRLVERGELPSEWDPATDPRLTVWETTQHLIRALESSETEAAALLARIGGGYGEKARQLAYLLYGVCDRKKWADEAGAYNMLVTAWPEIARLAAAGSDSSPEESLF